MLHQLGIFIILVLLTACGLETKVGSLQEAVQAGVDTSSCYHPDSNGFNPQNALVCTDQLGACYLPVCKDSRFTESELEKSYQRYINQYGGRLLSRPQFCQTLKQEGLCSHPDARNYQQTGACEFQACANSDYYEYQKYLDYQYYVEKFGGKVIKDQSLCENEVLIKCCTDQRASNFSSLANRSAECDFSACLQEHRRGHDPQLINDFESYIHRFGGTIIEDRSLCGEAKVRGCPLVGSDNFAEAAEILLPCQFTRCNDETRFGYDAEAIALIEQRLALYPEGGEIVNDPNLCGELRVEGCQLSSAENYDPQANLPGHCQFRACSDESRIGYNSDRIKEIKELLDSYAGGGEIINDPNLCGSLAVPGCQIAQASNFNASANIPTQCQFHICNDPAYQNYDSSLIQLIQQKCSSYAGGCAPIQNNPAACGDRIIEGCQLPGAINYNPQANQAGTCHFQECTDSTRINFDQSLIDLIQGQCSSYSSDCQIENDENKCGPVAVQGCLLSDASNYNDQANIATTCEFRLCLNPDYTGYEEGLKEKIKAQHASYDAGIEIIADQSLCGEAIAEGCMSPGAINYSQSHNREDGSCQFEGCLDEASIGTYDEALYLEIESYLQNLESENIDFTGSVDESKGCSYDGCTEPLAQNFNALAQEEDGSCEWRGCLSDRYQEYDSDLAAAYQAYLGLYPQASLESTCMERATETALRSIAEDRHDVDLRVSLVLDNSMSLEVIMPKIQESLKETLKKMRTENGKLKVDFHLLSHVNNGAELYFYQGQKVSEQDEYDQIRYDLPEPIYSFQADKQSSESEIQSHVYAAINLVELDPQFIYELGICYYHNLVKKYVNQDDEKQIFMLFTNEDDRTGAHPSSNNARCTYGRDKRENMTTPGMYALRYQQRFLRVNYRYNNEVYPNYTFTYQYNPNLPTQCTAIEIDDILDKIPQGAEILSCSAQNQQTLASGFTDLYREYGENLCENGFTRGNRYYQDLRDYAIQNDPRINEVNIDPRYCQKVRPQTRTTWFTLQWSNYNQIIGQIQRDLNNSPYKVHKNMAFISVLFDERDHQCSADFEQYSDHGQRYLQFAAQIRNRTPSMIHDTADICTPNYDDLFDQTLFKTYNRILRNRYLVTDQLDLTIVKVQLVHENGQRLELTAADYMIEEENGSTYIEFAESLKDTLEDFKKIHILYHD